VTRRNYRERGDRGERHNGGAERQPHETPTTEACWGEQRLRSLHDRVLADLGREVLQMLALPQLMVAERLSVVVLLVNDVRRWLRVLIRRCRLHLAAAQRDDRRHELIPISGAAITWRRHRPIRHTAKLWHRQPDGNNTNSRYLAVVDDEILNVAQVSAEFGVTPQTIRAWLASGKLKGRRVGKGFRILRSDLMAMLEAAPSAQREPDRGLWERPPVPLDTASATPSDASTQVWNPDAPSQLLVPPSG
jgi:excisionase family DNA binding protein